MERDLKLNWQFPLPHTHCGILMGNGLFGAVIWGDKRLCITLNRADFWDHRGHMPMTKEMNYANLRRIWKAGDEKAMDALVKRDVPPEPGQPKIPSGLPMGRIELDFGPDSHIHSASLNMYDGSLLVQIKVAEIIHSAKVFVSTEQPVLLIEVEDMLPIKEIIKRPSYEFIGEYLKSISFQLPEMLNEDNLTGWIQMRPEDPYMCLACSKIAGGLVVTSVYGDSATAAKTNAISLIKEVEEENMAEVYKRSQSWWNKYWDDVPKINLPSEKAEEIYYYGMFKFAGLTHPNGMAALLQGPWVEEYQMPDCSNDYHFNINVQMCYWPAYAGNRLEHLKPLFKKLKEWEPIMRHNARCLVGIDDGLYLTMSVSDIGEFKGRFWPGLIDFASTGWIAHLMWLYYKYSMDEDFLRDTAYPFMKGIMRVYEEVLEEENGRMVLPMSTSPEYNEYTLGTGGKNPSFQLACIHFLLESLIESASLLGVDQEKAVAWRRLKEKVPPYATINGENYSFHPPSRRIAIWEGQDLEWSHRHPGHLACIHPFDTVDIEDEDFSQVLRPTIKHWIRKGTGEWVAFSFVWASIIHSRLGDGNAAHLFLDLWHRLFTNEGRGAVEAAYIPGLTAWAGNPENRGLPMQMDAAMGAVNAIQEMLIHTVRGVLTVFPAVPRAWQNISFRNMRAEGAFLISANMTNAKIDRIEIISEKGCIIKIKNNIADEVVIGGTQRKEEKVKSHLLEIETKQGERLEIRPAQ